MLLTSVNQEIFFKKILHMAVKINHKESHCSQGPAPEISSLLQLQHSGTFWIFFFIMKVKKMFQFAPPCSSLKVILYQTAPE